MGRRNRTIRLEDLRDWKKERDEAVMEEIQSKRTKVRGKTTNHNKYLKAIDTSTVTICTGPAGTGKTYMACGRAAEMLVEGRVQRIVLSRPLQGCDEDPGFLPGDVMEKYGPSMQPMMEALGAFLDKKDIAEYLADGRLEFVPLAQMRGRTFHESAVILDEAQNATFGQLKMLLTRFGKDARLVINGDHTQSDLKNGVGNPLLEVIDKFLARKDFHQKPISIIRMNRQDIMRHPLIQWIDETLTGDFDEQESCYANSWRVISCPECRSVLHYEAKSGKDQNLNCWLCHSTIELFDGEGNFDPMSIDDEEAQQVYFSFTFSEKQ